MKIVSKRILNGNGEPTRIQPSLPTRMNPYDSYIDRQTVSFRTNHHAVTLKIVGNMCHMMCEERFGTVWRFNTPYSYTVSVHYGSAWAHHTGIPDPHICNTF